VILAVNFTTFPFFVTFHRGYKQILFQGVKQKPFIGVINRFYFRELSENL